MCNIAGYVGTKRAAPILLEMMRAQEGFCGGYYTGIATICEGKLYYAKLTGDVSRLEALTEAMNLPGTVGIIHSRSKSKGGDNWAHPFVCRKGGAPRHAYVANGDIGIFAPMRPVATQLSEELLAQGFQMDSWEKTPVGRYPTMSDGSCVHVSDTMCQLIGRNREQGLPLDRAMEAAFTQMPSEIVGLLLSLDDPEAISYARINMPMMLAFAGHGAYLSSSAMAIPGDAGEPIALAPCTCGTVYRDRYCARPFAQPPCTVSPVTARLRAEAYAAVCALLKEGPQGISPLCKAVKPLFDPADCVPVTLVVYDVLHSLMRQGRLQIENTPQPGSAEGLTAPKSIFSFL